ncbi:MAG: IS66-like element accessory protein TnpA [Xanthobacteraceae bacterium]
MSTLDLTLEPEPVRAVRRLEVITADGRRRWSAADKARIVDETLSPGAVVSEVARRHGLTPQQVFTWRRHARKGAAASGDRITFAPVVVDAPSPATDARIEIALAGALIRVPPGVDAGTLATILHALRSLP